MARRRRRIVRHAVSGLTQALVSGGLKQDEAHNFARLILSRPGIAIGPHATRLHGKRLTPEELAKTHLARYVTGALAEAQNRHAITSEAGYQQALAELGLQRDISTSGLSEQRRRSILDFGDPGFAGKDALLAAQARSNPLSTVNLLAQAYQRANADVRQTANRAGTLFGGGLQSGLAETGRINAAQTTEATRSLEDLLAGLGRQETQARQIYTVGRQGALMQAQNRLLAAGLYHAAKAPHLTMNPFHVVMPRRRRRPDPAGAGAPY